MYQASKPYPTDSVALKQNILHT
uniref:Uncharacterized protein n=1 Tax=Triticum urartu TaxID=4572 RepID=A0A8R7P969_TRIUA